MHCIVEIVAKHQCIGHDKNLPEVDLLVYPACSMTVVSASIASDTRA